MRLSDISGDRCFDVIADILDPIYNIAADEDAVELFQKKPLPDGMSRLEYGAKWMTEAANKLLRAHKQDCIAILSAIEGVSAEEYTDSLNFVKLIKDVSELMSDEAFNSLFFSNVQGTGISSGSARGNTGGEA